MISKVPYEVWHCDACGTVWLPRRGKDRKPDRCPNRQCRKLAGWIAERVKPAEREVKAKDSAHREADGERIRKHRMGRQMSADEFMNLPVSEQLRARREGKF